MSVGRLEEAEEWMAEIERTRRRSNDFGGASLSAGKGRDGRWPEARSPRGWTLYRVAVDELMAIRFPGMGVASGLEPWALFGESLGVTAFAVHGTTAEDLAAGRALYLALLSKSPRVLDPHRPFMDYPWPGSCCTGSVPGGCCRDAMPADTAVRLLVLAERFGYPRFAPTMSPERTERGRRAQLAPGAAGAAAASDYADAHRSQPPAARPGPPVSHGSPRPDVTSCGRRSAHGRRGEDRHDRPRREQRPADLGGDRAVVREVAHGGDEVGDRVDGRTPAASPAACRPGRTRSTGTSAGT